MAMTERRESIHEKRQRIGREIDGHITTLVDAARILVSTSEFISGHKGKFFSDIDRGEDHYLVHFDARTDGRPASGEQTSGLCLKYAQQFNDNGRQVAGDQGIELLYYGEDGFEHYDIPTWTVKRDGPYNDPKLHLYPTAPNKVLWREQIDDVALQMTGRHSPEVLSRMAGLAQRFIDYSAPSSTGDSIPKP